MIVQVTSKASTGKIYVSDYEVKSLSEFIYNAPEWDLDFDTMIKIEVV